MRFRWKYAEVLKKNRRKFSQIRFLGDGFGFALACSDAAGLIAPGSPAVAGSRARPATRYSP
jgi:hypothetical protein